MYQVGINTAAQICNQRACSCMIWTERSRKDSEYFIFLLRTDRTLVGKLRMLPSLMIVLGILKWISKQRTVAHQNGQQNYPFNSFPCMGQDNMLELLQVIRGISSLLGRDL